MEDLESVFGEEVAQNINSLPESYFKLWGRDGVWNPCGSKYETKTEVRSGNDALDAFHKYTEYFETVLDTWSPTSDSLVLVPCGSTKPIGSSTIHKKKVSAVRDAGLTDADIVVVSEPCVVVPPEYRLSVPATNYDFPPEYTVKEDHPEVFELFTDRLAEWLDTVNYDTIYPYLISGHMNKFESALGKMETNPETHTIPSASYNPDTDSYSGDRFKKPWEMEQKVRSVLKFKASKPITVASEVESFYQKRFNG